MSPISLSPSALKEGRPYEYLVRFLLGGAATVFTGFVSSRCGAAIGGLFLALPAIFCASATLIEKHEIRRKREAGLDGRRRGEEAAALESAGAVLGAFGMLAFAVAFSLTVRRQRSGRVHLGIARLGRRLDCGLVRPPQDAHGAQIAGRQELASAGSGRLGGRRLALTQPSFQELTRGESLDG